MAQLPGRSYDGRESRTLLSGRRHVRHRYQPGRAAVGRLHDPVARASQHGPAALRPRWVLSLYVCGAWHEIDAGTPVAVPRGTTHAQGNRGERPVLLLGAGNPAGFERFFAAQDEILRRIPSGDPQLAAELARVLRQHDTQVLGSTGAPLCRESAMCRPRSRPAQKPPSSLITGTYCGDRSPKRLRSAPRRCLRGFS